MSQGPCSTLNLQPISAVNRAIQVEAQAIFETLKETYTNLDWGEYREDDAMVVDYGTITAGDCTMSDAKAYVYRRGVVWLAGKVRSRDTNDRWTIQQIWRDEAGNYLFTSYGSFEIREKNQDYPLGGLFPVDYTPSKFEFIHHVETWNGC